MHYEIGYAHIEDWVLVLLLLNFKFYIISLETGSCCTAQAGPELPMETNLVSNQSRFPHICLSNPGVTGMCHPGIINTSVLRTRPSEELSMMLGMVHILLSHGAATNFVSYLNSHV